MIFKTQTVQTETVINYTQASTENDNNLSIDQKLEEIVQTTNNVKKL